jgi:hypothetical protein
MDKPKYTKWKASNGHYKWISKTERAKINDEIQNIKIKDAIQNQALESWLLDQENSQIAQKKLYEFTKTLPHVKDGNKLRLVTRSEIYDFVGRKFNETLDDPSFDQGINTFANKLCSKYTSEQIGQMMNDPHSKNVLNDFIAEICHPFSIDAYYEEYGVIKTTDKHK